MTTENTSLKSSSLTLGQYKAEFVLRGSSIRKWAIEHKYNPSVVYDALSGARSGPQALRILKNVNNHLGLN
jgi:gp16 family phage-associated protein